MTRLDAITNESLRISKSGMVQITNTASSCTPSTTNSSSREMLRECMKWIWAIDHWWPITTATPKSTLSIGARSGRFRSPKQPMASR